MEEIRFKLPRELELEFKAIPKAELSIMLNKLLMERLSRVVRFKQIVLKSQLTEKDAKELADEISMSLAKRYEKMFSGK